MCKNCDAWNDYKLEDYLKEDEEEEPLPEPEEYEDYDDEEGVYIPQEVNMDYSKHITKKEAEDLPPWLSVPVLVH